MGTPNHYQTLGISPDATQTEIKQAYRRLAKAFHPDSNPTGGNHEQIAQINIAYEVLSDPSHRRAYNQQLHYSTASYEPSRSKRQYWSAAAQKTYHQQRYSGQQADEHFQAWLKQVYTPANQLLRGIIDLLPTQVNELSADPFDDALMDVFQGYLDNCREHLQQAQQCFQSMPNPPVVAGVAAHLYHCLNQVGDGLEELQFFTMNYDEHYLHTGQELFRIAKGLRWEAEDALKEIV